MTELIMQHADPTAICPQVTSLLYNASKQSEEDSGSGSLPVSLSDFDVNTKLGDLKVRP